jgi:hypothetical protein
MEVPMTIYAFICFMNLLPASKEIWIRLVIWQQSMVITKVFSSNQAEIVSIYV